MACSNCPDAVVAVLRTKVRSELNKLSAIVSMTAFFNDAIGSTAGVAVADTQSAVDAIPVASALSPLDILEYVLCPLTPLALGLDGIQDLVSGDVNTQTKKVQGLSKGNVDRARREYEKALKNSPNDKLIRQARKYEQRLRQIGFDANSFAEAVVITATVQSVCDADEFDDVFLQFAQLAQNFSFTGGVPATLDQNLAALIQRLSQGEAKFAALRDALH
jgi:hypothetical protein